MQKRADYLSKLHEYLASKEKTGFSFGRLDCALFTAGAVAAMTDEDPAAGFRGGYKTRLGGLRKIRAAGFRDQIDFVEKTFTEIRPAFAQVGDVVLLNDGVMGICAGDRIAVAGDQGLAFVPLEMVARAFSIDGGAA